MALKLHLKRFTGLKERTVWQARATFRGMSYRTKSCALSAGQDEARLDEVFEWPIGRPIDPHETLDIHLINKSKYNIAGVNRSVAGTYRMVLQELLTQKHLVICDDVLIDLNNQPTSTGVTMELHYVVPNDSLYQVEQSLSELERQYAAAIQSAQASGQSSDTDTDATGERHTLLKTRKRSMGSAVRNIANIMKLKHKRRSSPGVSDDEADDCSVAITVGPTITGAQYGSTHSILRHMSDNTLDMLAAGSRLGASPEDAHAITSPVLVKKIRPSGPSDSLKAQDFQICVTIIEARHLAGLNMDPVVCVQVGEQRKYTSVKESTNCPYYNEYFVFDFHCAEAVLFDKMVTITALHSRNLIRSGKVIGTFKLDVATIFRQPDHQFWHKWAVLTDPDDMSGGPKGYVKCDISVIGKGEASKPPSTTRSTSANHEQDDDIEGNLLLPEGMPTERQHARYIVSIHEADGLPRANGGNLVASVKKVLAQDSQRQLIDPYVQVSFAGLTGKTSVKKSCCSPAWNEQIVFTEMFPPLCQRIKLQLRDNGPVKDSVIATHFIDISKISNDGDKGFLPTFGPCYIYLYGSARSSDSVFQRGSAHAPLNDGLAEGVMYRGRLLVSVRTQVLPEMAVMQLPPSVHVEGAPPVTEDNPTKNEDFFLSAVIMEGHMIDKRFADKPVHFELSIGNAGNTLDGEHGVDSSEWKSTTPSMKPISGPEPGEHLHMGFGHCKPVIWVRSSWPDYRRRLYLSNMLHRILERLEFGVSDVLEMVRLERGDADRRLRGVLEQLAGDCAAYLQHYKQEHPSKSSTRVRRSKLDRERERHCQREVDHMGTMARAMKPLLNRHSFKEKLQATQMFIRKLKDICEDAQHSLPDVFVWMLVQGRRVAYHRIPARLIIYSVHDEQRGSLCERRQTFLLKPGGGNKKQTPSSAWNVEANIELYIWLGLWSERDQSLRGVPEGYSNTGVPFEKLQYTERSKFILRAHMYQARSLIASDSSGLSDPFAQVHFCGHCASTQVIEQTLSPTWDEMVLLQKIELCGELAQLSEDPPLVVVNVFDQDNVGKCEFLGRAMVKPHVKLGFTETEYKIPQLEWHDLYRSPNENAGQLLAVFELIECNSITGDSTGRVESVEPIWRNDRGPVLPIPKSIRPTLSRYKIEFLFWGLRDLRRVNLLKVDRPRVDIECGGHTIQSSIINNYAKNPNFSMPIKTIDIDLPDQEIYCPPVTIRVVDCRSFGRFTLVGTHVISSIHRFIQLTAQEAFENQKRVLAQKANQVPTETLIDVEGGTATAANGGPTANSQITVIHLNPSKDAKFSDGNLASIEGFDPSYQNAPTNTEKEPSKGKKKQAKKRKERGSMTRNDDLSEDSKDWWSRYFASIQSQHKSKGNPDDGFHSDRLRSLFDQYSMIKVYTAELESVPEYNGFKEWLESFQLLRGKRTGDENDDERRIVGIFKGSLRVHRYPLSGDWEPLSRSVPSNDPIKVLVRVYIVRATDLHPADLNGKADPYLVIRLGQNKLSDKDNYVSKQLNPVFGKCFQFEAIFPHDSLLHIQVFDWDLLGRDDLIGETKIDLENRFYSKHRATCGLPLKYDTESGPNQWRDPLKPSQILQKICKEHKVDGPHCLPPGNRVRVGPRTFVFKTDDQEFDGIHHSKTSKKQRQENYEHMSLAILHRWCEVLEGNALVTEHVETRPLFHPEKAAGIEQGKLDMWVDMFPMDTGQPLPGPPVDISPRKPKSFELRVIIWNTDEVVLEDDAFFTGEKMSDIYVKGWLKGPEDTQSTDIHYRSLTGEGNFNWRFVFPFEYLPAEEKIVISRKESLFSWDETESKIPARLQLQVWDADHFSADDFLGALTLDLNRFPRGAKTATQCSLDILRPDAPHVSIFKQRRIKGWWPFFVKRSDDQQMELTGKVEAELHLLTGEEAERNPAGLGRSEPDPLEKPNRPDASFVWFLNPLKSVKYIVWHRYKWFILKAILIFLFGLMLALFVYSIPGYTVKKMLGA